MAPKMEIMLEKSNCSLQTRQKQVYNYYIKATGLKYFVLLLIIAEAG